MKKFFENEHFETIWALKLRGVKPNLCFTKNHTKITILSIKDKLKGKKN